MADLFVSYARKNRERVRAIADGLDSSGYQLWWDAALKAGENYAVTIEREIAEAKGVVVCWSQQAKESLWVRAEATEALDQDKLVQLKLDESRMPLPFNILDMVAFAEWNGSKQSPEWTRLDQAVGIKTGRTPLPEGAEFTTEAPPELKQRLQGLGPIAAMGAALTALVLLIAGATILMGEDMVDVGLYRSLTLVGFGAAIAGGGLIAWRFTRIAIATRRT